MLTLALAPAVSQAACSNAIACENQLPGTPQSQWQVDGAGDPTIQGFATSMSVNRGDTVSFKIDSPTTNYKIDILRLGYYGGDGARTITSNLSPTGPANQPACQTFAGTGLIDCGNWSVSRTWTVPSTAVSGVYIALLTRNDTGGQSHIPFIVRDDSSHSNVVLQTSDETWQAYNTYGGNSLYTCSVACPPVQPKAYWPALKVSYNRPIITDGSFDPSGLFNGAEYNMIRFMEANGYDVSYISGVDTHERGTLLRNHKLFMSSGHDEYWSGTQRANVTAARDAGVNLAFFSGNEMFWKTRFEPSAAGPTTADRTLVSYKDTHQDTAASRDPVSWTGTWRDSRFTTDADNVTPENALTGTSFIVNSGTSAITVPYAYRQLRMWRNTPVASLSPGQSVTLAPGTLGYEWDEDPDNGFRPAGAFRLSSTTVSGVEVFTDYGSTTSFGQTATHNLVMYRAPSGARVFGAGTVQWSWGLDDYNDHTPNTTMRQATVNLLADMGAQPSTLTSGLVGASATTDSTAPSVVLNSTPASVADGTQVTLTGTASDASGVVGGVEVSTDNGATWHPATGTTSWSYSWTAHGSPTASIKVRATDDSGNLSAPTSGRSVGVTCSCSIWADQITPPSADGGDPSPVEVGVKFKSDQFGVVTGIRFYKSAANTGTHVGSLWTTGGQRLAQATFSGESASGWQTVTFDDPVQVQPDTTYVASYFAPNGHYAATPDYFYRTPAPGPSGGAIADSPPLHAVRNTGTTTNGVFAYGSSSTFPSGSYGAANYWVDVRFTPIAAPGAVTGVSAVEGGRTSANVNWNAPSSGGTPTTYKVTPYVGSTAQAATLVTGTPPATGKTITGLTSGTTYRFTVQAINPTGSGPESGQSNAVTPQNPVAPAQPTDVVAQPASQSAKVSWTAPASDGDDPITGYTVTPYDGSTPLTPVQAGASASSAMVTGLTNGTAYTFRIVAKNGVGQGAASAASRAVTPQATIFDFATPSTVDSGDPNAIEVGVKFRADMDGTVTGVRFYKSDANTGKHTGSLWTAGGTRLAQATFSGETGSGWQTATFSSPIAVTAGTTYVASYYAPSGHYSANGGGLNTAVDNPPLHALGNATSANGVYSYSATSTFPTSTWGAANYWVDVMYAIPRPGQVTGASAVEAGRSSAKVSWSALSGGAVTSYRITPYVGTTAQPSTIVSGSPPATVKTVSGLTTGTTYRFTVEAMNSSGAGPASALTNAVTPSNPVTPVAPTDVRAQPATKSARVTWTAADSDGDSAITKQTVIPYVGGVAKDPVTVGASATSATITGLDNGTQYRFRVTATNDVGTSPESAASSSVTPAATIFEFSTPPTVDAGDNGSVELGVKFRTSFDGAVTGIRFYKSAANTGTHVGSLWSAGGTLLARATFSDESGSGWQSVTFDSPVTVTPGTTYVASYYAPNGRYSATGGGFSTATLNAPLEALADSTSSNGVFAYGSSSSFPSGTWGAANYWVDVLFAPAPAPGAVSNVVAAPAQSGASVNWSAPTSGGSVTSYDVTPYIGSTAQTALRKTVTGSPPATSTTIKGLSQGTSYSFTVRPSNPTGSGPESGQSNTVSPLTAGAPAAPTGVSAQEDSKAAIVSWSAPDDGGSAITRYTVTPFDGSTALSSVDVDAPGSRVRIGGLTNGTAYTFKVSATNAAGSGPASSASAPVKPRASIFEAATPPLVDAGDGGSVVLGVKFSASVAGKVTGVRFYKAAANTGSHVGALWAADGTRLATGTFGAETASGWQALTFDTPVDITPDTTYVASYLAPNGHYSAAGGAFASAVINSPLRALADSVSRNGIYQYSSSSVFPTSTWNATSYSVDVLFAPNP